jgi:hypothetical protein
MCIMEYINCKGDYYVITHSIDVEIRVGRENAQPKNTWTTPLLTNDLEIDRYGSVWGESEFLYLGSHFNLYSSGTFTTLGGRVPAPASHIVPTSIMSTPTKKPASSVSGNFGEVLTILSLESKVAPKSLYVSHLTSIKAGRRAIQCPDLIVESTPLLSDYSIFQASNPALPALPDFIPGECKNGAYLKALRQLSRYWEEIGSRSPLFGFGLISSINYQFPPSIKFNILVPENTANLAFLLYTNSIKKLVQDDFKGCLYGF